MARNKKAEKEKRPFVSKVIIVLLFIFLVAIYARYEGTNGIQIREYTITSAKIPESFDGFKIVQFSDLELNSTFNIDSLKELVEKINNLKPTIVVFTGDIIDSDKKLSKSENEKFIEELSKIDALIGKYAVPGDDDIKNDYYSEMIESGNFTDLTNKREDIYYKGLTPIIITGLDSLTKGKQKIDELFNEDDDLYQILLVHEPDTLIKVKDKNIDLMLSGHSHNSEINIPYLKNLYNIEGASTYFDSEYTVGETKLFISSGLGTTSLKMRLFAKPSISVFKLYHE